MAPPKVACYCSKDRGRLVSKKTFIRHGRQGPPTPGAVASGSGVQSTAPAVATSDDERPPHSVQHGTRKRTLPERSVRTIDDLANKRPREISPTQSEKGTGSDNEHEMETFDQDNRSNPGSDLAFNMDTLQDGHHDEANTSQTRYPQAPAVSPAPSPTTEPMVLSAANSGDEEVRDESDDDYGPSLQDLAQQDLERARQEEAARQAERFRELEEQQSREQAEQEAARQAAQDAAAPPAGQAPPIMDPNLEEYLAGYPASRIERLDSSRQFMEAVQQATLDNGKLSPEDVQNIRFPPEELSEDISDKDVKFSLDLWMSLAPKASEASYNVVRDVHLRHDPSKKILSAYSVKKLLVELTGITAVRDDMCPDGCAAYTGPYENLQKCPICSSDRYCANPNMRNSKKVPDVPRLQMVTIPLGQQLQALRRSEQGSKAMSYRARMLASLGGKENEDGNLPSYEDILSGKDIRDFANEKNMTADDIVVGISFDGAQLYRNKQSDTWVGVWIVYDYHPTLRYKRKHILPAFIVPGPKKPKNIDSYFFRSFHHLSALQRENNGRGIRAWDYEKQTLIWSRIFFILAMADAIALCELDGRAGHHAARGCRLGCPFRGRYREGSGGHYFSAHLCPNNYNAHSNHPDFDFRGDIDSLNASKEVYDADLKKVLESRTQKEYEDRRKATGISKPSLVSGLLPAQTLLPPKCFSVDIMHLLFLNLADLMISLFRGEMRCEPTDKKSTWAWMVLIGEIWLMFGKAVAGSAEHYPSHFHRPPRNPCEKISSGYKATEFYKLLIDLMPAYLYGLLEDKYWRNFCRLVHGVRILVQRKITYEQVIEARTHLVLFVEEFEHLYYQRRLDRMHFCRPCLHTLLHTPPEILRTGPGAYDNQFPMERIIGQLGSELRQPGTPFANLMEIAVRRSQTNAIKVMYPELDSDPDKLKLPKFAEEVGGGYVFLRPRQFKLSAWKETDESVRGIIEQELNMTRVAKWGRLRLPNGQTCRSHFCEANRKREKQCISRNVRVEVDGREEYAEVQFFFYTQDLEPKAIISLYEPRCEELFERSRNTVAACEFERYDDLRIVDVKAIKSVASMQPMPPWTPPQYAGCWFVVEKSGLEDVELAGWEEQLVGGDDDDYEEADA